MEKKPVTTQKKSTSSAKVNTEGMDRVSFLAACLLGKYATSTVGTIKNFSPNNVKSIIIGRNRIFVIYHIDKDKASHLAGAIPSKSLVGTKLATTMAVFDYSKAVEVDAVPMKKVNSIFGILDNTKYKKFGFLEDIIVLKNEYDMTLLNADLQYYNELRAKMNRFENDRFRGIFVLDLNAEDAINKLLNSTNKPDYFHSVSDVLLAYSDIRANFEANKRMSFIVPNKKDWYKKGTLVGGNTYEVEKPAIAEGNKKEKGGVLWQHFERMKDSIRKREAHALLMKKKQQILDKAFTEKKTQLVSVITETDKLLTKMQEVYDGKEVYTKVHWAFCLDEKYVSEIVYKKLSENIELLKQYSQIDWKALKAYLTVEGSLEIYDKLKGLKDDNNGVTGGLFVRTLDNYIGKDNSFVNDETTAKTFDVIISILKDYLLKYAMYLCYFSYVRYAMQAGGTEVIQDYLDYLGEEHKMKTISYHSGMVADLSGVLSAKDNSYNEGKYLYTDNFKDVYKLESASSITIKVLKNGVNLILKGLGGQDAT